MEQPPLQPHPAQRTLRQLFSVRRLPTLALIALMYVVVALSVVDLTWTLIRDIVSPPMILLDIEELLDILNFFLLVLIAIELLDTIIAYLDENVVHVEVVLEVAMIAIARKIIILDIKEVQPLAVIGIGVIIIALAAGFYVVKKTLRHS
ncbi:MAG TPA: phosphate-starvation-inducible PsiE family protein [Anaerolineaceae bacterium]|nr:phosphate-starvation-inducible PsiE family protein [Anaerolineaceae bacterium]HQF62675.1 phosphate-starvation-inducible PsiE family protein [Anaerolineaceae bacterium]